MRNRHGPAFRLATLESPWRGALAAMAGALAGLGHVPFSMPWLALAGFALAAALCATAPSARRAAWSGWIAGGAYFALTLHWIVEPFLVDAPRHGWMAPFALAGLALGLALFWAFAGWAARRFAPGSTLGWALALSLAELARGHVLTGFPWALPGYIWTETDMLQAAALVGPYGLTALTLLAGGGLARLALGGRRRALPAALVLAVAVTYAPLIAPAPDMADDRPVIRLVQPNAPQDEKWDPEKVNLFFSRQIGFTAASPDGRAPDLVVWPETAIPWSLERADDALAYVAEAAGGTPVILGANRRADGRVMNALAVIGGGGGVVDVYDKHHLVPFGEYMPFPALADATGLSSFTGGSFTPGPGPRVLDLPGIGRALPLICYEAIFPALARAPGPARPDLLLQITNDAWFGEFAGPGQHLAQARSRAVEQGLPLVRVANTGISAMIDAQGRVTAVLPLGEAGYSDAPLPPPGKVTVYSWIGDIPLAVALVFLFAACGIRGRNSV